mgnify:CR=1 FL=1
MKQFVLLLISFCYGSLSGFFYYLFFNKVLEKFSTLILKTFFFIIITLLYIILIYLLNKGSIHLYMKFLLIGGFIFTLKMSKICKKIN